MEDAGHTKHSADMALNASPSVLFDAIVILAGADGDKALTANPDAVGFIMDACRHLKAIGLAGVPDLAARTQVSGVPGVAELKSSPDIAAFIELARGGRVWARPEH